MRLFNPLRCGRSLAAALTLTIVATTAANAEGPDVARGSFRSPSPSGSPQSVPLFFQSSAGTTWVQVHSSSSTCAPADTVGSPNGQSTRHVWCFEGANGDSTWPAVPAGQNNGTKHETWDHWSKYAPRVPAQSKWHLSQMNPGASTGTWNAWCGCDSLVGVSGFENNDAVCDDFGFWLNRKGYANDWNYALELRADGVSNATGSTIKFDVRYDTECNYDYLYVEYSTNAGTTWSFLRDSYPNGRAAVFNAVSGNPAAGFGGTGRPCGGDYFESSDQFNPGGGNVNWNGDNHSLWKTNVTFNVPPGGAAGVRVRWRAYSDGAWSDLDGRVDTDGHSAVDNVVLTVASSPGNSAADNFETGTGSPLDNRVPATETLPGSVLWKAGPLLGNTYDGWHLEFDPKYQNKGNSCTYSNDWMWAAKPAGSAIPASARGFDFFLVSPVINCNDWEGGLIEFDSYFCTPSDSRKSAFESVRIYDAALGWSPWNSLPQGFEDFGCDPWRENSDHDLTEYLGTSIDSLQVGWELLDFSNPGDLSWGKHNGVQYLIDNVSFGSFDLTATAFHARSIDLFTDSFSLSDPAHTAFLQNAEQGVWSGLSAPPAGTRSFAAADSLTVEILDNNGVTAANVVLHWRHDDGGTGTFGAFQAKAMSFAVPNPSSPTDEGTYRAILGADNGGIEDVNPPAANRLIWKAGTTVQYYIKVTDNAANVATFPNTADDPTPKYNEFSVLPFGNTTTGGHRVLFVDDVGGRNALDFENSAGFNPDGGYGWGDFEEPKHATVEVLFGRTLQTLFGGSATDPKFDKYDVLGAGSSVQCEPRGLANPALGLGGLMNPGNQPNYDVLVWPQLDLDAYSFADTTRIDLKTYLNNNGNLLACGNDIAFHHGAGGNDADSTIGFLNDYFGTTFPISTDNETLDRVLNVTGSGGTSLENVELGLYGECPLRWYFDRLTMTTSPAIGSQASTLATYTDGNASDNGRAAIIKNTRAGVNGTFGNADDGVAVLCGFDLSALLSDASRACIVGRILATDMGIAVSNPPSCIANGVGAPVIGTRYGFQLAAPSPNPFAEMTAVRFSIAARERVVVEIYNILGQKVRTLVNESLEPGSYVREWDGRTEGGNGAVSNGIYFAKMVAGAYSETKKVVLLK